MALSFLGQGVIKVKKKELLFRAAFGNLAVLWSLLPEGKRHFTSWLNKL